MSGWQRIGIVLTAIWLTTVSAYAAYERAQLPIKIFGEETENPGDGWNVARNLFFIDIESDVRDLTGFAAAADRVVSAPSETELAVAIVERDRAGVQNFHTSVKEFFWICLLVPIAAFWVLSFLAAVTGKWVIAGFAHGKNDANGNIAKQSAQDTV